MDQIKEYKGLDFLITIKHLKKSDTLIVQASYGNFRGVKRVQANYYGALESLNFAIDAAIESCYEYMKEANK